MVGYSKITNEVKVYIKVYMLITAFKTANWKTYMGNNPGQNKLHFGHLVEFYTHTKSCFLNILLQVKMLTIQKLNEKQRAQSQFCSILFLKKEKKQKHRDFPGAQWLRTCLGRKGQDRSLVGEPRPHMSWDK